jgi:hypothetical protein
MSKKDQGDEFISVCDIMKNNTSKIIKKLEMQIPTSVQMYSNFYRSYLHSLDDIFGTCYIAEKEVFDKMGFDQNILKNFQKISDEITGVVETQIEIMNKMQSSQLEIRDQLMKAYDTYVHFIMDSYSKYLSMLNVNLKKIG